MRHDQSSAYSILHIVLLVTITEIGSGQNKLSAGKHSGFFLETEAGGLFVWGLPGLHNEFQVNLGYVTSFDSWGIAWW